MAHQWPSSIHVPSSVSLDLFGKQSSVAESTTSPLENDSQSSTFSVDPAYAILWVALVAYAFSPIAPGSLGSPQDNALLETILADPVTPNINPIFFCIFNLFAPMPLVLAALLLPQQPPQAKLPAGPFLLATSAIGYFALGPYLALRPAPQLRAASPSNSVVNLNLTESSVACALLALLCGLVYAPLPAALADAAQQQEFVALLQSSRFCAIACIDLFLLYIVTTVSVYQDVQLRYDTNNNKASTIALATALVPYLGAAVYCTVRPKVMGADASSP